MRYKQINKQTNTLCGLPIGPILKNVTSQYWDASFLHILQIVQTKSIQLPVSCKKQKEDKADCIHNKTYAYCFD